MQRVDLIGMGVIVALLASGAGAAECRVQHDALVAETPDLDKLPPDQALLARRTLRELSSAVRRLDSDGHEAACVAALDALARALTDYKMALIETEPSRAVGGGDDPRPREALNARDPRLVPLTAPELAYATGEIEDNSVFSYGGEYIGEFQGLLTGSDGYVTHLVIGHGGFWDMFEKRAAIPIELVRWDRQRGLFYLSLAREELAAAPVYGAGETWDPEMNDDYYASLAG